ncbi:MAG: DUF721 domain-containing protein [Planctomycetaceae bacterium]|nr:DUF721 domain-containing protein [Planctomycetaceae bacterium]
MKSSANEDKYLRSATHWQQRPKNPDRKLGGEIFAYLQQRSDALEKNAALVEAWEAVVPAELSPYCRLDKRAGGVLYVQAMPGPYMYRVRVCSDELLERLKQAVPRCGINKIKVVPMEKENSKS